MSNTDTIIDNSKIDNSDIVLGKEMTNAGRALAYFSIAVIYFFYCYNFTLGIFVKPTMVASVVEGGMGFTLTQTEEIFAVMSFGTIPGTFIFAKIATFFGKKRTLVGIGILIGITTYLPMLDPASYNLWLIARSCAGLVLGATFGAAMPLIADMFPTKYRGKLAASLTTLFSLATMFAGMLYGVLGDERWEWLVYTAVIPPIIGAVMTFFFVPDDYAMTKQALLEMKEKKEKIGYLTMYQGKYLWIGIGAIILSGANFTAYSSFNNNATTYLVTQLGISSLLAGSFYSLQGFGLMLGYISWGSIADKFGRKVPLIGMALNGVCVFIYTTLDSNSITMFYVISLLIGFTAGYSGAWGAYYTELFPNQFRALSAGMSFNGGRIISTFALPAIASIAATSYGFQGLFFATISTFFLGAIVWAFLPETLEKKITEK